MHIQTPGWMVRNVVAISSVWWIVFNPRNFVAKLRLKFGGAGSICELLSRGDVAWFCDVRNTAWRTAHWLRKWSHFILSKSERASLYSKMTKYWRCSAGTAHTWMKGLPELCSSQCWVYQNNVFCYVLLHLHKQKALLSTFVWVSNANSEQNTAIYKGFCALLWTRLIFAVFCQTWMQHIL